MQEVIAFLARRAASGASSALIGYGVAAGSAETIGAGVGAALLVLGEFYLSRKNIQKAVAKVFR